MVAGGHAGDNVFITEPEKASLNLKRPMISVDGRKIKKVPAYDDVIRIKTKLPDEPAIIRDRPEDSISRSVADGPNISIAPVQINTIKQTSKDKSDTLEQIVVEGQGQQTTNGGKGPMSLGIHSIHLSPRLQIIENNKTGDSKERSANRRSSPREGTSVAVEVPKVEQESAA